MFVNSVSVTLLYISRCCYYFESRIFFRSEEINGIVIRRDSFRGIFERNAF